MVMSNFNFLTSSRAFLSDLTDTLNHEHYHTFKTKRNSMQTLHVLFPCCKIDNLYSKGHTDHDVNCHNRLTIFFRREEK